MRAMWVLMFAACAGPEGLEAHAPLHSTAGASSPSGHVDPSLPLHEHALDPLGLPVPLATLRASPVLLLDALEVEPVDPARVYLSVREEGPPSWHRWALMEIPGSELDPQTEWALRDVYHRAFTE